MTELYRKAASPEQAKTLRRGKSRRVCYWEEGDKKAVQFNCPCGARLVYVTQPEHTITFREDGVLESLGGSCGYHERPDLGRPQNWCHFTIQGGKVETMHTDSKCPGGDNSIP